MVKEEGKIIVPTLTAVSFWARTRKHEACSLRRVANVVDIKLVVRHGDSKRVIE